MLRKVGLMVKEVVSSLPLVLFLRLHLEDDGRRTMGRGYIAGHASSPVRASRRKLTQLIPAQELPGDTPSMLLSH
jgi:hypothetical protein